MVEHWNIGLRKNDFLIIPIFHDSNIPIVSGANEVSKKVAIVQSNYIPWKGYFDLINMVDEFILYDDVQYTKNDWRNRNKIKTSSGVQWLTIPVQQKHLEQKIRETKVANSSWRIKHWKALELNYARSRYFKDFRDVFEALYLGSKEEYLSNINYECITAVNRILGIATRISWSSDYELSGGKSERLVNLCQQTNAKEYISGPAARNYIDEKLFQAANITLTWMDYSGYREYSQIFPPFEHAVSIIDLIFNEGPKATTYMKSF